MSRYGDDIRRIARYKDTKDSSTVSPDTNGALDPVRGIAYKDNVGNIQADRSRPGTSLPNVDTGLVPGISDALASQTPGVPPFGGNQRPAGENDESTMTIEDIIDGNIPEAYSSDYPLKPITDMTDIYTGDPVQIRLDGAYRAPGEYTDAGGNTLTWEHIDSPPGQLTTVTGGWFLGGLYAGGSNTPPSNSYQDIIDQQIASDPDGGPFMMWRTDLGVYDGPPNATDSAIIAGTNNTAPYFYQYNSLSNPGVGYGVTSVIMFSCTATAPNLIALMPSGCGIAGGTVDRLPASNIPTISLQSDGRFKSTVYDKSDVGQAYQSGVSTYVGQFASSTRYGVIQPGLGNTYLIYEVDSNGAATGTVRQYTRGLLDTINPGSSVVSRPNTLVASFPAADINNYRLIGDIQPIRLGGVRKP